MRSDALQHYDGGTSCIQTQTNPDPIKSSAVSIFQCMKICCASHIMICRVRYDVDNNYFNDCCHSAVNSM